MGKAEVYHNRVPKDVYAEYTCNASLATDKRKRYPSLKLQLLKHALRMRDGSLSNCPANMRVLILILGPEQLPPPQCAEHITKHQDPDQHKTPGQHTAQHL